MDIGPRLRAARQRRALSLYDVGERTGRHFSTIAKYERGERRPDLDVLRELAHIYEVSVSELIGESAILDELPPDLQAGARALLKRSELRDLVAVGCRLQPQQVIQLVRFLSMIAGPPEG